MGAEGGGRWALYNDDGWPVLSVARLEEQTQADGDEHGHKHSWDGMATVFRYII